MTDKISNQDLCNEVEKAHHRIKSYIRRTPLEYSAYLSERTCAKVYLKLESEQITGAFKARGAFNKVLKFSEYDSKQTEGKKFFTASSGNHGMAMTMALQASGKKGTIYVPNNVAKSKFENLVLHKADVRKFGDDCMVTEREAMRAAKEEGGIYVSPYNDPDIIAGQGTIGLEILQDLKDVDAVFVTVGGGGMISGISSYLKQIKPSIKIIGCSPVNSNVMEQSAEAGRQIEIVNLDTLSDGSAGNIDIPSITFPICQRNVDRWVNVTEDEIADAMYLMLDVHHKVIEGAAGVALASFLKVKADFQGQNVAVVICGSGVGIATIKKIIDTHWKE
uniref:L-threonine dehydratase catabolic TdcB-like n=1 Tax=Styela clava TaxID=7725 RepID=UPI001939D7A9|nr:L-threonine dehydratase catabolic TdcB-like [Styela clava]